MTSVRDATIGTLRRLGVATLYANPGSTEISFLADFPDDLRFVLALHEGSVVGLATGQAIATGAPAVALLHTTAGLGNAVGALATARVNRAPLLVLVGQQDRRHLALEPFLTGKLTGLAGDYPVWVESPARAQDVPGAVARGWHEAVTGRGPALVIVPSGDWQEGMPDSEVVAAPRAITRAAGLDEADIEPVADMLTSASTPVLVSGAGSDEPRTWDALVALAERLRCPVWQEPFGARAGFPQDHPQYAGVLPADRSRLRAALREHDVVVTVGAAAIRQYPFEPGPLVEPGTAVAVVIDDPDEAHRSPADQVILASLPAACERLARRVPARTTPAPEFKSAVGPAPPASGEPLRAGHVLAALASLVSPETIVVEETPSSRPELHRLLPARRPLGFVSAAMGGLGFALPAATGLRMARPDRPVVAVVGDGSAIYGIQALWSAAQYGVGVLFVILANGRYAVMDRLAEGHGDTKPPWPDFSDVNMSWMARSFGCPALRLDTYSELTQVLGDVVPQLAERTDPLLLDVSVAPDPEFHP
ncbi:thiamine pyrophosphate-binding protein [Actinobacteria bacterium YIM 96077]|uniref:Thiamine pyrophosphate-binding protein n=1 Tax=Phytoactinopolyspora halophila TaxID=1981511 RepID=A0A329QKF9_9ACTN|nr:thiamine pyrophosphate-binding protein [Actinobacteria bacterium YIM 96077]RAW10998.1 thiamine pyrophosphate-binding protein [Phytoactinopolyspora halophila]